MVSRDQIISNPLSKISIGKYYGKNEINN